MAVLTLTYNGGITPDILKEGLTSERFTFKSEKHFDVFREFVHAFGVYVTMVVFASGLFGNLLSIIVFIRLRKKDAVTATYLTPIAVYDLTNICIGTTTWLVQAAPAFSGGTVFIPEAVSDVHCKIRVYISLASGLMSTWTLIAFCIERCIAIWFPLKLAVLVTSTRRQITIVVIILVSLALAYSVIPPFKLHGSSICIPMPETNLESAFLGFINFGVYLALPIVALSMLNALLVCGLSKQDKTLNQTKTAKSKANEHKIVRNLFLLSCVYVITMTPFCVFGSIQITRMILGWGDVSSKYIDMFNVMVELAFLFHFTNYSANYLIYAASLDFYRAECRGLFGCDRKMKRLTDDEMRN
jgi:hypothetical protein